MTNSIDTDTRLLALRHWLAAQLAIKTPPELTPTAGDASSRRYFRLSAHDCTRIAVDAPPTTNNNANFIRMATALQSIGLQPPDIIAADLEHGFLLISDLGTAHYLDHLTPATADRLYSDALGALLVLQAAGPLTDLPEYDAAFFQRELALFTEWLLEAWLDYPLTADERQQLAAVDQLLINTALEQPRVCVHRDYHSRNLMITPTNSPGILDFQDAVIGPVTYDLVSLLRDCYIDWPAAQVEDWAWGYFQLAVQSGVVRPEYESDWLRWFDLMGMQRHLKAAGIFARLMVRDGKPNYLAHLPRTLGYVIAVAARYPALHSFGGWLETIILPRIEHAIRHLTDE